MTTMTDLPLDLQRIIYGHKYRMESKDSQLQKVLKDWSKWDGIEMDADEDVFVCVMCADSHFNRTEESLDLSRGRDFCRVCRDCGDDLCVSSGDVPDADNMWWLCGCEVVADFDDVLLKAGPKLAVAGIIMGS